MKYFDTRKFMRDNKKDGIEYYAGGTRWHIDCHGLEVNNNVIHWKSQDGYVIDFFSNENWESCIKPKPLTKKELKKYGF